MAPYADARRFCVLVVDDNRAAADTLAMLLRLHGHDARAVGDGEAALAIVRDWQPDAAILDIVMSGLNGIELADRIRREATRPMLLVALTGLGTNDELAPVKAGAFDSVLLKPADADELLGLLDAYRPAAATALGAGGLNSDGKSSHALTVPATDRPVFGSAPSAVACHKRRAAYAIILGGDGRVVSACRPRGFWLPGGGILPGEGPEDAVKREVREELGRAVRLTGRVGEAVQYFDSPADGCWYEMMAYFFAAEFDGEPQGAGEEEPCWLDPDRESGSFFHASHAWAVSRAKGTAAQSAGPNGQVPPASASGHSAA
jgi:CheY-like chemotaxis protein/ADP-ribose pyrophosphatase YjhB (NUDIX family)